MKTLLRISFFCLCANWLFGTVYGVVYVRTQSSTRNETSIAAIQQTVSRLNAGAMSGNSYKYVELSTFTVAMDFANNPQSLGVDIIVANIYHGVFDLTTHEYTHNVQDESPDSTPDADVDPYVDHPYHCNEDGCVSNDQIANDIISRVGGSYPPPASSGSGSGGGGSGGSGGSGGTWSIVSYQQTYVTFRDDPNGGLPIMTVNLATVTVWIWTPNSPNGQNYLALYQQRQRKSGAV